MPVISPTLIMVTIALGAVVFLFVWLPLRNFIIPIGIRKRMIISDLKPKAAAEKLHLRRTASMWIAIGLGVVCAVYLLLSQWLG